MRKAATVLLLLPIFAASGIDATAKEFRLQVHVIDAESNRRLPARLYLYSDSMEPHYFSSDHPEGTAVRYEKQNWINERSVEYHTTVSAHSCTAYVPPGDYVLTVVHGKSYFSHSRKLHVDEHDHEVTVELQRWNDPSARGWFSGDTHLHRTPDALRNVVLAEDLNVALPLTYWVTHAGRPPSTGDQNQPTVAGDLIRVDQQHVIWPRNTEYEISKIDGKRHMLGALFVLGHDKTLQQAVPPWGKAITEAKRSNEDVVLDMDKFDWPVSVLLPTLAPNALYELANNHVWRAEFAFRNWSTRAPPFIQPPYGGSQGGHRQWIDYTLGMYYTLLNCGFKLPPSAGTASGVHPVPAGFSRVYVHLPGGFDYDDWMQALKAGRSFVTTGPMLYVTADGQDPGHTFHLNSSEEAADAISLDIEVVSESELAYGELLLNGKPVQLLRPENKTTADGAFRSLLQIDCTPERSGWFAVRFWESRPDGQSRFAHSAPWYVEHDNEPVRPSRHERDYLIQRTLQEMQRSKEVISAAAVKEYEKALDFYRSLPVRDNNSEIQRTARPGYGDQLGRWLDNMIVDHRFTPHEVRAATGLSWDEAEAAIQQRRQLIDQHSHDEQVRILPYPGGRHPRRGFLEGAVDPQRETKVSIFPPWEDGGYVVVDVPEAIFSNLGLTYLAHTHIPTVWDKESIDLPELEWEQRDGRLVMRRELPNGIRFTSSVTPVDDGAAMKIELHNGTDAPLSGLRVQVCAMLKGTIGFNIQEELERIVRKPLVAVRSDQANRWIITGWRPCHRVWTNPPVPCIHSDPVFPDCPPGTTVTVEGGIWFYEGKQIDSRLESLMDKL